jgi:opacity protein-like surface antigen
MLSFGAGKDIGGGGRSDDRREEKHDEKHDKKNANGKNPVGVQRGHGKYVPPPRLRPKPTPIIVSAPRHSRPRPKTVVVSSPTTSRTVVINSSATHVTNASSVVTSPSPAIISESHQSEPIEPEPIYDFNDEFAYVGLDFRIGAGKLNQSGFGVGTTKWYNETHRPIDVNFDLSIGYKIPYFRVGGEMGFGGLSVDVEPGIGYVKEEDSISMFTFMPHFFLDLDTSLRVSPYIGFAVGLNILHVRYDCYSFNTLSPDNTPSATAANLTYAVMLGTRISLTPKVELNVGYRFQDYGSVELKGYENKLLAHEFNMGMAFKF